jgi:hypothetical protein
MADSVDELKKKISAWKSEIRNLPEWKIWQQLKRKVYESFEMTQGWDIDLDYDYIATAEYDYEQACERERMYKVVVYIPAVLRLPFGKQYFEAKKRYYLSN